jgi:hydroxymethylpyrimidine/phosphomethylpyrimidine kinase
MVRYRRANSISKAAAIVTHIRQEINLHINECKEFGLTQEQMETYDESQGRCPLAHGQRARANESIACTAYSRYVLDIGQSEDWLALQISLLPCLLGYNVVAKQLDERQKTHPPKGPNRYRTWINNYIADDYAAAVETGCGM